MRRKTKARKKKSRFKPTHKVQRRKNRSGGIDVNVIDFLFESVYQVITWVIIGMSIAAIGAGYAQQNWRLVIWAAAVLCSAIVAMIGIIAFRHFFNPLTPAAKVHQNRSF